MNSSALWKSLAEVHAVGLRDLLPQRQELLRWAQSLCLLSSLWAHVRRSVGQLYEARSNPTN